MILCLIVFLQVHFLPCNTCGQVFPGVDLRTCRRHKLDPTFGDGGDLGGLGRGGDHFPCCGARALRFSPLPLRNVRQFTLWSINDHYRNQC